MIQPIINLFRMSCKTIEKMSATLLFNAKFFCMNHEVNKDKVRILQYFLCNELQYYKIYIFIRNFN